MADVATGLQRQKQMSHRHLLALLGSALIVGGAVERGWTLLALWLGCNVVVLAVAYGRGFHRVFGKRPNGALPLWSRFVFFPLLIYSSAVWRLLRLLTREPPVHSVTEHLLVGRRLVPSEVPGEFDNYVDLTAEFSEPSAIRCSPAYVSFPILDGAAPSPEALREAVRCLRPGRTFIHCAQGHGRTGLFALAVLLSSGVAHSVADGLRVLQAARPGIRLNRAQRRCAEMFAQHMAS